MFPTAHQVLMMQLTIGATTSKSPQAEAQDQYREVTQRSNLIGPHTVTKISKLPLSAFQAAKQLSTLTQHLHSSGHQAVQMRTHISYLLLRKTRRPASSTGTTLKLTQQLH